MESFDLIIKNGNIVLDDEKIEKNDIGIRDSKIISIDDLSSANSLESIDASNLHILPGCIDTQVHFREPGLTHKEDLLTGSKGAVLGGVTGFFEMPNTRPPTITKNDFEVKVKLAEKKSYCNFSFFVGAAKENIDNLKYLERLPGCCGVKIFMGSSTGDLLVEDDESLRKIFLSVSRRISIHSEDEYRLRDRKNIIENPSVTVHDHEVWRDNISALNSTKRLIEIAREVKRNIHILHISSGDELELIAKNKDLISAEVTPQHLFFHSPDCYNNLGTLAQMNPPIRGKKHQDNLWKAIKNNIVDIIGSDHAPHTLEEKKKQYPNSPSGMTGVQTLVPILLDFVNKDKLSIFDLVKFTSTNPSRYFKIKDKGLIKVGYDADFTIVDLNKTRVIENNWIASKAGWTPYDGLRVKGWPILTIINGKVIMREDQVLGKPEGKKFIFSDTI